LNDYEELLNNEENKADKEGSEMFNWLFNLVIPQVNREKPPDLDKLSYTTGIPLETVKLLRECLGQTFNL